MRHSSAHTAPTVFFPEHAFSSTPSGTTRVEGLHGHWTLCHYGTFRKTSQLLTHIDLSYLTDLYAFAEYSKPNHHRLS